ncbi:MAG: SGNH/GDSL hydrolase family protein, partial [Clostridia bacterium]|nr:SGNH/GDSL hydrolase family protein [Clostridia bacterium]
TSSQNGLLALSEVRTDGKLLRPKQKSPLKIEFVGDSITVGAGVFATSPSQATTIENSDATKGYAYLTAQALGADCSLVATEGICTKAKWVLPVNMQEMYLSKSSVTTDAYDFPETAQDLIVVALGTNDSYYMGSGISYTSDAFSADYKELLTLVRSKNATAKIVCIYGMMGTHAPVAEGIQKAIADFHDENVSYFAMPAGTDGGGAHPSAENAVTQSAALTAYLKELLKLS